MKKIKFNGYEDYSIDDLRNLKLIIGYRKNGEKAFELENFGKVWVFHNFDLKDYKGIDEFNLDEVMKFLKDMNRRKISYELFDYGFLRV
jgi:hypothetical protein